MKRFETFRDMNDQWRWRLIGGDSRVLSNSNAAFGSQAEALRAAEAAKVEAREASVSITAGIGPKIGA